MLSIIFWVIDTPIILILVGVVGLAVLAVIGYAICGKHD
jgi:hypothetical protein